MYSMIFSCQQLKLGGPLSNSSAHIKVHIRKALDQLEAPVLNSKSPHSPQVISEQPVDANLPDASLP